MYSNSVTQPTTSIINPKVRVVFSALTIFSLSFVLWYEQSAGASARAARPAAQVAASVVTNADDSGAGSLRQAISDANAATGVMTTIMFDATFFSTSRTINLLTALPNLTSSVTINGPGANLLTVQRAFNAATDFRVFTIPSGVPQVDLRGMTISNGRASDFGGGIRSFSNLTLTNVAVTGNQARFGGGVSLRGDGVFTGCTFNGNIATDSGGGINYSGDSGRTLRLVNSTVSGNSAASSGGGILNGSLSGIGRLEITSSTIASNTAVNGGGILTSAAEIGNNAATTLRSTIIAGSTPNNLKTDVNPGATATITSLGFNLTDDNSNQFLNQATDLINTNPLLAPLALNGGQTPTHALLFGSRALDAGHSSGATTDQRGAVRPFDILGVGMTIGGDSSDIGAVEMQVVIVVNHNSYGDGSLREAIASAPANGEIWFAQTIFNIARTITLDGAELIINKNLKINGPGANLLTVSGLSQSRIFSINGGVTATLKGLTITRGAINSFGPLIRVGGGILNHGHLTVLQCHITDNIAEDGGGIYSDPETTEGGLIVSQSTVSSNTATGNTATGVLNCGGGIRSVSLSAAIITDSTISSNSVNVQYGSAGGGIYARAAKIINSTIVNNRAIIDPFSPIFAGNAGGVLHIGPVASLVIRNSIIAGNVNNSTTPDIFTSNNNNLVSEGFNLIGNRGALTFNAMGDQSGAGGVPLNPRLSFIRDNGGSTPTHPLEAGSPALDAGHSSGALTDQRGLPRRFDIPTINNQAGSDSADIGAYEAQSAPVQLPMLAIINVSQNEGNSGTTAFGFTVTLSAVSAQTVKVSYATANGTATGGSDFIALGASTLTFDPGQISKTVTVLVNGDTTVEPDETFFVNLMNATNATIADAQGQGTIVNDDFPASLIVQNTNDSGTGSLRQVIAEAQAGSTVRFAPAVFNVARTIALASEIQITMNLTVNGPGANLLTLSGNNNNRVLRVLGSGLNVTLNDLTISNGRAVGNIGGGIYVNGTLTLNRCAISNNTATGGGGIFLQAGAAGIFTACTFNGNTADLGGALYFDGVGTQQLKLTNCTISGNTGTFDGGAILHYSSSGNSLTEIVSCTIANNMSADGGGLFIKATGAGVTPHATTRNSIYANNTNMNLRVLSENGSTATITSLGYNLTTSAGSGLLTATSDQLNTDPLLGPLQNNGGPTPTRALLPLSPARDNGHSSTLMTDQRSSTRPYDDPGLPNVASGNGADIGAFEQGQQLAAVSAASYQTPLASESIAAVFGVDLSNGVATSGTIPLPTLLNEASFIVRDSLGVERLAPLFFVSPGQVNLQIPPGTSLGTATMIARRNGVPTAGVKIEINAVEPGLFTANATGAGYPAGLILRVRADGSLAYEPIAVFNQALARFDPVPIDFGAATDKLFLVLYGTGIRGAQTGSINVSLSLGGTTSEVLFAGPVGGFVGLDQINSSELPRSFAGRGAVNASVFIGAKSTNTVLLNFK